MVYKYTVYVKLTLSRSALAAFAKRSVLRDYLHIGCNEKQYRTYEHEDVE